MTMVHVRTGPAKAHVVQINPHHVGTVKSPPFETDVKYNTIIVMSNGEHIFVIEPRDVVFSLIGRAAMDNSNLPGYLEATPGVEKSEWNIKRRGYEE